MSLFRIVRTAAPLAALSLALLPMPSALAQADSTPLTTTQIFANLDPDMATVLEVFDAAKGTRLTELTPQDARQQVPIQQIGTIIARLTSAADAPMPVGKVTDGVTIPGREGNQIPVRIYTPAGPGPFPVVVYFHGGGFVIATIDTYDASPRALSNAAKAIVVSVEYRKAPEAPFPAARHDAIDAYQWVTSNIGDYNGIASKVAVAGESAGGNLATEVAIAARNQDFQRPTHQLLIYPVTSSNVMQPSDLKYTSSALPLNTDLLKYFFKFYSTPDQANLPQAAPINANLRNLPPTTIIAAEEDPLVSDGQAYANKLKLAGNKVTYQLYTGTTHEFFGLGAVVAKAQAAEQFAGSQLAASF